MTVISQTRSFHTWTLHAKNRQAKRAGCKPTRPRRCPANARRALPRAEPREIGGREGAGPAAWSSVWAGVVGAVRKQRDRRRDRGVKRVQTRSRIFGNDTGWVRFSAGGTWHVSSPLIFARAPWAKLYFSHFTNVETEDPITNLTSATELVRVSFS